MQKIEKLHSFLTNDIRVRSVTFFLGQIPVEFAHFTRSSGIFLAAAERARKNENSRWRVLEFYRTHPDFSIEWNLSIERFRDLTFT